MLEIYRLEIFEGNFYLCDPAGTKDGGCLRMLYVCVCFLHLGIYHGHVESTPSSPYNASK